MSILVCGGAGYIGSHTCVELLDAGCDIVVADNLSNSSEEALRRVEKITGKTVPFVKTELCNPHEVEALFAQHPDIDAVIHFAGLKAVGESVEKPWEYYYNNITGTLVLCDVMRPPQSTAIPPPCPSGRTSPPAAPPTPTAPPSCFRRRYSWTSAPPTLS